MTRGYRVIVSIAPKDVEQAKQMAGGLSALHDLVGIEINLSCQNVADVKDPVGLVEAARQHTDHPIIVKLGYPNYLDNCKLLEGMVDAFDLINSVPWRLMYPDKHSPVGGGGVSGHVIKQLARDAVANVSGWSKTPIISGGGIDSAEEVFVRYKLGARAFTLGTVFLKKPWLPNRIVSECRSAMKREN